jgi:transcriptional regulator with XRE-family HTH domain
MNRQQKKDYAKMLYLNDLSITQKEIAERAGVAEKTVSNWVNKEGWDQLRTNLLTTRETQLSHLYKQLQVLNKTIAEREDQHRYANSKEADVLIKLTSAIRNLEQDMSIADIVSVAKRFLNYVRNINMKQAKEISALFDSFIKDNIR